MLVKVCPEPVCWAKSHAFQMSMRQSLKVGGCHNLDSYKMKGWEDLSGIGEDKLNHLLWPFCGFLQEQFHCGCHKLQLHLGGLFRECLKEKFQELVRIVYPLSIFTNDPDHAGFCLWLIQCVQVLTEGGDDALIPAEQ